MRDDGSGSPATWSRAALDPQLVALAMRQRGLNWPAPVLLLSVPSTFQVATELAAAGAAEGSAVVAEEQTAGRGRQGRSWASPLGAGLWLTVIVDLVPAQRTLLPLAAGLAVRQVVQQVLPEDALALVKWPNDVVVAHGPVAPTHEATQLRGKIAGVLVEVREERCLVGMGLNISLTHSELPAGVLATSLLLSQGSVTARERVLVDLLAAFRDHLTRVRRSPQALLAEYRSHSATLGRTVEVTLPGGRQLCGRAVAIDVTGGLIVEEMDGNRELVTAGDVIHATI